MPNELDADPDNWRDVGHQHKVHAAKVREFGRSLLETGLDGTAFKPFNDAVDDYNQRKAHKAERLAADHDRAYNHSDNFANSLEHSDRDGDSQITRAAGTTTDRTMEID
ncbi:MAG: hypothetical protein J2P18_02715 [Nocardia sp.]|nr:hypothetical protein [Nocardia sp.]